MVGGYTPNAGSDRFSHADRNRPLYMISVAAELAGVHPQTLRTYEQKGLLNPQRTNGGTRMYSQADLDRLQLINELTAEGINLAGVMRILDLQSRMEEFQDELSRQHEELSNLHKRYQRLAQRVIDPTPEEDCMSLVRMVDLPPVFHWLTKEDVFRK